MSTKSKALSIRVDKDVFESLKQRAELERRTISGMVNALLAQGLDTTTYLLSSEANRQSLEQSIQELQTGQIVTKTLEELETAAK